MGLPVVTGATILCTMGTSTGSFIATNQTTVLAEGKPVGVIMDSAPMTNIAPCGMCTSMANPAVASATSAAMGVLTPQPCVPAPAGPWICPGTVLAENKPILTMDGKLMCSYAGNLSFVNPGQTTVII